ncbi:hypothetical protein NDU88_003452 [Pleurodeles waltl]|uniref:Uncharacterized protein n=1 Tax=Pleurodeles waltl TaxID=8319 RepID=A0AAV7V030_PLEWA|nr:hypothetical protein NDU88_003452 [Pleurodeles waltl]
MPRGRCVKILDMQDEVTGVASIRWSLHENFGCTAGAASIPLGKSGCIVPVRLCVRFGFALIQWVMR